MKVLVKYSLGIQPPEWIVVESDLSDLRDHTAQEIINRAKRQYAGVSWGMLQLPPTRVRDIEEGLKIHQFIAQQKKGEDNE
jgi:hypothetical protein